ncbi:hypothetical protein ACJZ2D_011287 [Fusarium nematophilum]
MSASLAPECNEVKERYDTCFLKWYSEKYLRGQEKDNKECADLFKDYQKCLKVALKDRGIDKLVEEAREENKENDLKHLGSKRSQPQAPPPVLCSAHSSAPSQIQAKKIAATASLCPAKQHPSNGLARPPQISTPKPGTSKTACSATRNSASMHPFSILTLGIFVAGYTTARWDLVTRLYELAIFAWENGVVVNLPPPPPPPPPPTRDLD